MEELNLNDLSFDDSNEEFETFVASDDELENLGKDKPISKEDDKKPNSEENDSPESVAVEDKNKQVQGGKTPDGEGSDSSSPKNDNGSEQLYSTLATHFKSKGVLPGLENTKDIKSLEDIEAAIQKEVESRLDEKQRAIDEALQLGLPAKEVSSQLEVINGLKSITPEVIESEDNQEFRMKLIAQEFLAKGYSQERAVALAKRSVDLGSDIEDAKFALEGIINHEVGKYQKILNDARERETKSITDIKDYLEKNEEVITGIKLNSQQRDELYKQITTDLGDKQNAFMKAQKQDPIGSRIKLETIFFLTKGLTDFSVFTNSKESDISRSIENMLRGTSFTEDGKVVTDITDDRSSFRLSDFKDLQIDE